MNSITKKQDTNTPDAGKAWSKKAYTRPKLSVYGDVRDLTLAPTPYPTQESGTGLPRRVRRNLY